MSNVPQSSSITEWLESLGLAEYRENFDNDNVELSTLPYLTSQDLEKLGVRTVGHRVRLLRAIKELPPSPSPASDSAAGVPAQRDGERRQVTHVFCDLVDSSVLANQLSGEVWHATLSSYQNVAKRVIRSHKGTIRKEEEFQGDGVLGLFGWPLAHAEDAQQAILAGLALVDAVANLNPVVLKTGENMRLQVRIGIATGTDVVREGIFAGNSLNLASRLKDLAEPAEQPGVVVISAETRDLAGHLFECRYLGERAPKGWPQPIPVWQVLGQSSVESPFEARHKSQLPPLRGRDEEMSQLRRRWLDVANGESRVVVLTGDAGVGKSHMVFALQEEVEADKYTSHTTLRYFCLANHENSALHPFISQLARAAHFERQDSNAEKLTKLATLLANLAPQANNGTALALMANLLSLPIAEQDRLPKRSPDLAANLLSRAMTERDRLRELSPEKRKDQTLKALLAQIDALAARRPVLMIVEDAQWMDPTSKELLTLLVEREARLPILLLVTARTDTFKPSWASRAHAKTIVLSYLFRRDCELLATRVAAGKALPADVMKEILDRAEGLPLYVEEYTKTVLESELLEERDGHYVLNPDRPLTSLAIPATLHDSLKERLDRLREPARAAAEVGAVIGREFSYDLIDAIPIESIPRPHRENLEAALGELERSELVFRRGEVPHAVYRFKHALLREEAYEGLVNDRRIELHAVIADVLETKFREIVAAQPETLAHHLSMAKLPHRAIPYWLQAGRVAASRFANREAIANLERGIIEVEEANETLPESLERDRFELELNYELARCLIETTGPASKETDEKVTRVRQLCEHLTDAPEYPRLMFWLATASVIRGKLKQALNDTAASRHSAEALGDQAALINAVRGQAMIRLFMGQIVKSREGIKRAVKLFDKAGASQQLATRAAGQDAKVSCHALMSWVLWLTGDVDKAVTQANKAIARARTIGHPHTEAYACYYASILFALRNEHKTALDHATRCRELSEEHGFKLWLPLAQTIRGICMGVLDHSSDSLQKAKADLQSYQDKEPKLGITVLCTLRAQALLLNHRPEEALEAVEQGLSAAECYDERILEAELCRLKARALLDHKGSDARTVARFWLEKALATARVQCARSLENRAEDDIDKLLASKGRRAVTPRSGADRARNRLPHLGR